MDVEPRAGRERPLVDPEARVVVRVLAAGADERVAPGRLGQVGREVVAAHDRVELDQLVAADRLAHQLRRALLVDDRLVAELEVELVVGAVGGADPARDLVDQLRDPLAHVRGRTSAWCRSARRGRGSRSARRRRAGCRRSRPRAASGSIRRETMCWRLPTSSAAAAIVSVGGVRQPRVAALAGDRQPEEVRGGHELAGDGGDLAELQRRPQVAAVDEVDALHHARGDEVARAAGSELLGVLEDEAQLAAGQVALRVSWPAAPSSIAVCPSCPQACIAPGRSEANSTPLSSWIGSASMSARSATVGPGLPVRSRASTLVSVGRSTVSARRSLERLRDERRRLVLVEADLGMAVQVAPPGDHIVVDAHAVTLPRRHRST